MRKLVTDDRVLSYFKAHPLCPPLLKKRVKRHDELFNNMNDQLKKTKCNEGLKPKELVGKLCYSIFLNSSAIYGGETNEI